MASLAPTALVYPLVVLDLEWNQHAGAQKLADDPLPQEIIEIGAIKLNAQLNIVQELQCTVRPTVHPVLQHHVRTLTGMDTRQCQEGIPFVEACTLLKCFCGPTFTLLTWGPDDYPVLQKNLTYWKRPRQWLAPPVDAQLVYAHILHGGAQQVALSTALLALGLPQERSAHRALHDAYHTALVWQRLQTLADDMRQDDPRILGLYRALQDHALRFSARDFTLDTPYATLTTLLADPAFFQPICPVCRTALADNSPRIAGGSPQRFDMLGSCARHGAVWTRYTIEPVAELLRVRTRAVLASEHQAHTLLARYAKQLAYRSRPRTKSRHFAHSHEM